MAKTTSTARKAAAPKPAQAVTEGAPEAEQAADATAGTKAPTLKIRDLVARVAERQGGNRKQVKDVVEATLAVLGEALARGEDMNLPGLGKTRVARSQEKDGAAHMTLKVRRGPHKPKEAKEPLAEDEVDS
ncbi:MAG: HU family DNA-binding protein [Paracoccaceae bacterium]